MVELKNAGDSHGTELLSKTPFSRRYTTRTSPKLIRMSGGRPLGSKQPFNTTSYQVGCGQRWRVGATLPPENADKLIAMTDRTNLSISGVINALIAHVELNPETGLPKFLEQAEPDLFTSEAA